MSSFNSIINRNDQTLISRFRDLLSSQAFQNENQIIEEYLFRLKSLKEQYHSFNEYKPLYFYDLRLIDNIISSQSKGVYILLKSLEDQLNEYLTKTNRNHESSVNLLRRLRQKLNTLDLIGVTFKFLILESFSNYNQIKNNLNERVPLNVDLYGKIATLPIEKTEGVSVYDIYIGAESNGVSGNPNDNTFGNPNNLINGLNNSYYEYFKLDDGPLILNLTFEFVEENILNEIRIIPQNKISNSDFEISNIKFISSSGKELQIKEVCDLNEQTLKVRVNEKESQNVFKFLPVKATKVSVSFKQSIPGRTYLFETERDFYSIAIKDISFYRNKYLQSGEISSNTFGLSEPYYSVKSISKCFPKKEVYFNQNIKLMFNNNSKQEKFDYINGDTDLYLLEGSEKDFIYQYQLNRIDEALDTGQSFKDMDYVLDIKSKSQPVLKDVNPNIISFDELHLRESLNLIQPKLCARDSEPSAAIRLGFIQGATNSDRLIETILDLPFNVNEYKIDKKDIHIYGNNIEWNQKQSSEELERETWCLLPNGNQIKLKVGNDVPFYTIKWLLNPVMPLIHEKQEGYYLEIFEPHDYDQNNIYLYNFDNLSEEIQDSFPFLETGWNKLSEQYIDLTSFKIGVFNSNNNSFDYDNIDFNVWTVDSLNGYIKCLNEDLLDFVYNFKYQFYKKTKIEDSKFDTWMSNSKIKGLFIEKQNLKTLNIDETAYQENEKFDFLKGGFVDARNNLNTSNLKWFSLKYSNIVGNSLTIKNLYNEYSSSYPDLYDLYSEVDYIDGRTEFLTTERILNDYIPDEEVNFIENVLNDNFCWLQFRTSKTISNSHLSLNLNEFIIKNNNRYYGGCKILDSEFTTINNAKTFLNNNLSFSAVYYKQSNIGIFKINMNLLFGVNSDSAGSDNFLVRDFSLSYLVDKEEQDPRNTFKYSVDYRKGNVYLSHPILIGDNPDTTILNRIKISYKVSNCIIHYQLCKYLTNWAFNKEDGIINLDPSEMKTEFNQIVKILYGQSKNFEDVKGLKDYFSPIIYSLQIGFN